MQFEQPHLSGEELLLSADGELSSHRKALIHEHLEACWECRARLIESQNTIAEFVRIHHGQFDDRLPSIEGPRARLRAQLRQMTTSSRQPLWGRWIRGGASKFGRAFHGAAAILAVSAIVASFVVVQHGWQARDSRSTLSGAMPRSSLTPGEAAAATSADVCAAGFPTEKTVIIPASLKQSVFERYGMPSSRPDDFEVDYLITPDLGGATTIRNLWPEPYYRTAWNAHVKDQLETRLKDLVCSGKLDLATAQHDISADWIAAYKKYFGTASPVGLSQPMMILLSSVNPPETSF